MNRKPYFKYIIRFVLLLLFVAFIHNDGQAQFWKRKFNKSDKNKQRTGVWKLYWDDKKTILMSRYKFKAGKTVGISKTFHSNGRKSTRLKYLKNKRRMKFSYFCSSCNTHNILLSMRGPLTLREPWPLRDE